MVTVMKYAICFDTICDGYTPICEEDLIDGTLIRKPIQYNSLEEAQAEIDSDKEFYEDCFACSMDEIGHKSIYYGGSNEN